MGNPEKVLKKEKIAVFIDGCFWHGNQGCKKNRLSKKEKEYWVPKIARNKQKDFSNLDLCRERRWEVITACEYELRKTIIENIQTGA